MSSSVSDAEAQDERVFVSISSSSVREEDAHQPLHGNPLSPGPVSLLNPPRGVEAEGRLRPSSAGSVLIALRLTLLRVHLFPGGSAAGFFPKPGGS